MYDLYIFDLDDVLIHEGLNNLCDDTLKVLEYLYSKNKYIILASHNTNAKNILEQCNILKYFDDIYYYYDDTDKRSHLSDILNTFSFIDRSKIIFYDDLESNINTGKSMNIKSILVDWTTGIKFKDILYLTV